MIRRHLPGWLSILVVLSVLDAIWLSTTAQPLYFAELGGLLRDEPVIWAAALFYVVHALGLQILIVDPSRRAGSAGRALATGALFGICVYAGYDLTNHATLRDWSPLITIVDMAWGTLASAVAAYAGYRFASWYSSRYA